MLAEKMESIPSNSTARSGGTEAAVQKYSVVEDNMGDFFLIFTISNGFTYWVWAPDANV